MGNSAKGSNNSVSLTQNQVIAGGAVGGQGGLGFVAQAAPAQGMKLHPRAEGARQIPMQGTSQRNTQKIQSNKLVSLNLTQPVQADLYNQGQFLLQNQNMKHNVNVTNQHRKLTQLQNREGQFMMN